jgi:hypothetical protein
MRRGSVAKEARRTAANERQAERDKRTDEQQHRKLVNAGHGHCKEALRLVGEVKGEPPCSCCDDPKCDGEMIELPSMEDSDA